MSFVKFSRGLISVYNNLTKKDPNTLYLVYEDKDSLTGYLYLGDKLISGVDNSSNISLNNLIDGIPEDGMILQYNASTTGHWEAVSIPEALNNIPEYRDRIFIETSLENILDPKEKDLAIIDNSVYIFDGENWEQLTNSILEDRLSNLESQIGQPGNAEEGIAPTGLYKDIIDLKENTFTKTEILQYIEDMSHLKYQIVNSLEDIDLENEENTANIIFLVPKDEIDESNGYDEYFVINNNLERIGSFDIDLSNYVQINDEHLLTEEDKKKLDSLNLDENDQVIINVSQVGDLNQQFIQDRSYIRSVQPGTFNVTDEGQLELVSIPSRILSDYVPMTVYQREIGDLSKLGSDENVNIVQEIINIKESITWQSLVNETNHS